ncbi:MAG: hypothetical protein H6735_33990 [Alphaproteobacteria bacterium]|nr:hypothetical protein [Alphaproteobacteria bacterium]
MSLMALWTLACIKAPPPVVAPEPLPVTVAAVVESYTERTVAPGAAEVIDPLHEVLSAHGLQPADASAATVERFTDLRSTDARLEALGDGVVLLVELAPRYSSQMSGRYRWTVDTAIHLQSPEGPEGVRELEVPVHLIYAHQKEEEAAAAAMPVVAREVSAVLDDWLQ